MSRALGVGAAGVVLALGGLGFGVEALSVPGFGLALLGLGSWAWVAAAARGASVVRSLPGDRVQEEDPFPVRLCFTPGLVPAPRVDIADPLLAGADSPLGRRGGRVRVDVRFARRGRRRLDAASVTIRDPLSLAVRVVGSEPARVLVLPRIEPVSALEGAGARAALSAGLAPRGAPAEIELDSLRPYRDGAPAARIHWPTVARTGEMVERNLVAAAGDGPVVVLDAHRPDSEEALDRAVRATASLLVRLGREGQCAVLLPGERRPRELGRGMGGWVEVHARLAFVEAAEVAPSLRHVGRRSTVWVTARSAGRSPEMARGAAGGGLIVTPTPLEGMRLLSTVAGCSVHALEPSSARSTA